MTNQSGANLVHKLQYVLIPFYIRCIDVVWEIQYRFQKTWYKCKPNPYGKLSSAGSRPWDKVGRGGGGPVIQTLRKGGARSRKKLHFGPHFGGKIRGGTRVSRVSPLDPPLLSLSCIEGQGSISGQAWILSGSFSTAFRSFIDHHTHFCIFICSSKNKKIHI